MYSEFFYVRKCAFPVFLNQSQLICVKRRTQVRTDTDPFIKTVYLFLQRRIKMNNTSKKITTRQIVSSGMLAAVAIILQYIELPIPMIMPSFIKFDFSDLPALIGAFAFGPVTGVLIELVKNLLHCLVSQSATVGELSNFILGAVFTFVAGAVYRRDKTKKNAFIGGMIGAIIMGLVSIPSNYFIVYPFYYNFMSKEAVLGMYQAILPSMKNILSCLIVFNLPFTIVKGLLSVLISMLIYKPLSPILKGQKTSI